MTDEKLTGRVLEELIMFRSRHDEAAGHYILGRYGVQGVFFKKPGSHEATWQPVQSYPDFEGIVRGGRQFIFEAKVCSGASFDLAQTDKFKNRQYTHLCRRSLMGAMTFLLIHFNARALKTKSEPAATFAIPVHPDMQIWQAFENRELKTLSRTEAAMSGIAVPWNLYSDRASRQTPDIFSAIAAVELALRTYAIRDDTSCRVAGPRDRGASKAPRISKESPSRSSGRSDHLAW